jgi:murein DD-endopeptidase MepM/ murein hydrolase activator NlpD
MGLLFKRGFIYKGRNPRRFGFIALMVAVVIGMLWVFLGPAPSRSLQAPVHKAAFAEVRVEQPRTAPGNSGPPDHHTSAKVRAVRVKQPQHVTPEAVNKVVLTVARGDTFAGILRENGISESQVLDIMEHAKGAFDLSGITAGNELTLIFNKDNQALLGLEYEIADLSRLIVSIEGDTIEVRTQQIDRIVKSAPRADTLRQVELQVRQGDNIFSLLKACGIGFAQIHSLFTSTRREYNLADITPGHPLKIWVTGASPRSLERLTYDIDPVTYIEVVPKDGIFQAKTHTRTMEVVNERAQGTITDSLYESAVKSGLSPEIVMSLTDIFGWDINFFTEIRDGDTFTVLYEKYYVQDNFKGYGRILAARFVVHGEEHLAVYYDNGKGMHGYYDEHGKPIRKLFLKAPLNYRRISSFFSYHRIHPVFHVQKPHLGVDYAAPSGTPVVALGEGRISACGWSGGFGKAITICHPGGYITHYGHLCRFAKGITTGKHVSQGDVIGYVGMTGIATGPHLDFRVQLRARFVNPLRLEPVNGPALHGSLLARFKQQSLKELTLLDDRSLDKSFKMSKSG